MSVSSIYYGLVAPWTDIARMVDLSAAYAWSPTPLLHEARIGVHSEEWHAQDAKGVQWRGTLGMVRLPENPLLEVEGGPRLSGSIEVGTHNKSRRSMGHLVGSVKVNDPEVLAVFPYAEDAVDVYLLLQGGGR